MNMSLYSLPEIFNAVPFVPAKDLKNEDMSLDERIQKKILRFRNLAYDVNNNKINKQQLRHRIEKLDRFIDEQSKNVMTEQEATHLGKLKDLTKLLKKIPGQTLTKNLSDIYISSNNSDSPDMLEIALYQEGVAPNLNDIDWKAVGTKIKPSRCQIITLSVGTATALSIVASAIVIYVNGIAERL